MWYCWQGGSTKSSAERVSMALPEVGANCEVEPLGTTPVWMRPAPLSTRILQGVVQKEKFRSVHPMQQSSMTECQAPGPQPVGKLNWLYTPVGVPSILYAGLPLMAPPVPPVVPQYVTSYICMEGPRLSLWP